MSAVLDTPAAELVEPRINSVAVAGVITHMEPIPGADLIQLATAECGSAGTWRGVVGKAIGLGDQVTVFLQDALLQMPTALRAAYMAGTRNNVAQLAAMTETVSSLSIAVVVALAGAATDADMDEAFNLAQGFMQKQQAVAQGQSK